MPALENKRYLPGLGHQGFTLIEVLFVAVIAAILAGIAYPSYRHAIIKSRRAEAKALLFSLMQQQERYYSQTNTYIAFSADSLQGDANKFKWFSGEAPKDSAYEIDATSCEGETIQSCVKLRARPGSPKVNVSFADPDCGELSLASNGAKSAGGNISQCW